MTYELVLAPAVANEIRAAYMFISRESPPAADRWYLGCADAIDSLATNPARCGIAPEAASWGRPIRHHLYGNYRILFEIKGDRVWVYHVRHGAMRPLPPPS